MKTKHKLRKAEKTEESWGKQKHSKTLIFNVLKES